MNHAKMVILAAFVLLAMPVAAATDPCPQCPFGGKPGNNSWDELKAGGNLTSQDGAAAHTGLALSKAHDHKGVWAWWGLCLDAILQKVGLRSHTDASAFASEDGVDVNGHVAGHDVDQLPVVGKIDDATWQTASKLHSAGVNTPHDMPVGGERVPNEVVDVCLTVGCPAAPIS